jgi:cytoskeleton-associated protein 5
MAKVGGGGSKHATPAVTAEAFKYKYPPEVADGLMAESIPEDLSAALADGAWKVRLECLDVAFPAWLDETGLDVDAEILFRFLAKKPGWNEKNFQVRRKKTRAHLLLCL